jgi:hypothetical protein
MTTRKRQRRPPRSIIHKDRILRTASDYLEFDIHSFAAAIEIYKSYRGTEPGNAALDSLLVRGRVLIDFFMARKAKPDDVIALDYFHDNKPKPYRPFMPRTVKREREKINKRLMHLTTKPMPRLRSNQKYALGRIAWPIIKVFRQWLAVVPDSRLQRSATKTRATYERHLGRIEKLLASPPPITFKCIRESGHDLI